MVHLSKFSVVLCKCCRWSLGKHKSNLKDNQINNQEMFLICKISLILSTFLLSLTFTPASSRLISNKETLKQIDRFCVINASSISNVFLGQIIIALSKQNEEFYFYAVYCYFSSAHKQERSSVSQPFLKWKSILFYFFSPTFKSLTLSSPLTVESITLVSSLCPWPLLKCMLDAHVNCACGDADSLPCYLGFLSRYLSFGLGDVLAVHCCCND